MRKKKGADGRAASGAKTPVEPKTPLDFADGTEDQFAKRPFYRKDEYRWGAGGVRICDYIVAANGKNFPSVFFTADRMTITFKAVFERDVERPLFGLMIKTLDGMVVYGTNSDYARGTTPPFPERVGNTRVVSFTLPIALNTGSYLISVGITDMSSGEAIPLDRRYDSILVPVENSRIAAGQVDLDAEFVMHDIT